MEEDKYSLVIPGRDEVANPESITTNVDCERPWPELASIASACGYGFRIRRLRVAPVLALDECFLDHEMTGLAVAALGKAAGLEHLLQLVQHRRAATHHDTVGRDI